MAAGAIAVAAGALTGCGGDSALQEARAKSTAVLGAAVQGDHAPGCSAAVAIDGRIVWAEARGVANIDTKAPLRPSTPVNIASTSKQFTAMAVLMLAERGSLALDDSPALYLDRLPAWAGELTLRDLLHHTSGLTDFLSVPDLTTTFGEPPITSADILEFVRTSPAARTGEIGSFDYSNTNYNLLAEVVHAVTGTGFAEWMQANIFGPLDLEMRFWPALASDAVGHAAVAGEFQVVDAGPWTDVGSGGIMTTPSELARWADHIRKASLVRAATFDQALLDAVEAPKLEEGNRYGPGLRVRADGSLWHGGHGEGELTRFEVSADRHTAMAITCNHKSIDPADISAHLRSIWAVTPEGG